MFKTDSDNQQNQVKQEPPWWHRALSWAQDTKSVAHLIRATYRYLTRLGNQFAGSLTFFSILALVPVLMFAFSALGLTLTVIRPEWMDAVQELLKENIHAGQFQDQLMDLISSYMFGWRQVGVVAIITAFFAATGWIANLKNSVRAISRPDFNTGEPTRFFVIEVLLNFLMLISFLVLVAVSLLANMVGVWLANRLVDFLATKDIYLSHSFITLSSMLVNLVAATLIFLLLFRLVPEPKAPNRAIFSGSIAAGVGFVAMQFGAGWITQLFATNRSTQLFGPIIVIMLFLNIFARMILFITAWIATWVQPAVARTWNPADEILRDKPNTVTVTGHWLAADKDRETSSL